MQLTPQLSCVVKHLLPFRNSTGYFFAHPPCIQKQFKLIASLAGSCSRAHVGLSLSDCPGSRNQPASHPVFHTSSHSLPTNCLGPWQQHPESRHAEHLVLSDAKTPVRLKLSRGSPPTALHRFCWQRPISSGGARKVVEQQAADEKEQAQLRGKQTKSDRFLGARKAKDAEHQSVIALMSDVRVPRSLLNKSAQQKWEVGHVCQHLPHQGLWTADASAHHAIIAALHQHPKSSNSQCHSHSCICMPNHVHHLHEPLLMIPYQANISCLSC